MISTKLSLSKLFLSHAFVALFLLSPLFFSVSQKVSAQLIDTENYDGGVIGGPTTISDFTKNDDGSYTYTVDFPEGKTINIEPVDCDFIDRIQFTLNTDVTVDVVIKRYLVSDLNDEIEGLVYQVCEINLDKNLKEDDISDLEIRTVISKEWFDNNDTDKDRVSVYRIEKLSSKDLTKVKTGHFTSTRSNEFFESQTNELEGIFLIADIDGSANSIDEEVIVEDTPEDTNSDNNEDIKMQYLFLIPVCCAAILIVVLFLLGLLTRNRKRDQQEFDAYNNSYNS